MYAILQQSGHQYRVSPGDRLVVDRLAAEVGSVVALEPVVLVQNDEGTQVGTPVVSGARVAAVVVAHSQGAKIRVFKFKAKKRYRRTHGHRSALTELRIEAVLAAGEPLPELKAAAPKAEKTAAPAAAAAKPARSRTRTKSAEAEASEAPEAETPEAWGGPEVVAEAPSPTAAGTTQPADADEPDAAQQDSPPKRTPRPRTKKTPAAESGDSSET
ncbi:MAG TPA: 50S ribosomal protein L21 [Candidatus Angelobacter sp.]|jgi:large subunit ribosomal protein L21|nr:50S ribosomal protein L21 [Candidatus Angelobacter sp.]